METKLTRIYQDVDGCLNASWNALAWKSRAIDEDAGYRSGLAPIYHSERGVKSDRPITHFKIEWNRFLVEEMNRLEFDLVWLTTWRADALQIGRMLNLTPADERVLHPISGVTEYPSIYWKYDALVEDHNRNPSPFVWIDDELRNVLGWKREVIEGMGGLIISPDPNFGVTPDHIAEIKEYIS